MKHLDVTRASLSGVFLALACAACSDEIPALFKPGSAVYDVQAPAKPTYYEHVQPIIFRQCLGCHSSTSVAYQRPLISYGETRNLGAAIRRMTSLRLMPPWGIDNSGACNRFVDTGWLSDVEIATLAKWVDQGAPAGDPAKAQDPAYDTDSLDSTDPGVLRTSIPFFQPRFDEYRCFVLDVNLPSAKYLTAFQFVPSEPRAIHHSVVYSLDDELAEEYALARDAASEGDGYPCPATALPAEYNSYPIGFHSFSRPVVRLPEGSGVLLQAHRKVVVQTHFANHSHGGAEHELQLGSSIDLYLQFADQVAKPARTFLINNFDILLYPGHDTAMLESDKPMLRGPSEQNSWPVLFAPGHIDIYGIYAHMHGRGRKYRLEYDVDGQTMCLLDVPRFVSTWERYYFAEQKLTVPAGVTYRLKCSYDTAGLSRDKPVTYGHGGRDDEMCLSIIYATAATP
jgi:hypothetical protein